MTVVSMEMWVDSALTAPSSPPKGGVSQSYKR